MQSIQEFFLNYPVEYRYLMLIVWIFLAGIAITPAPSDIVLSAIGVLVAHGVFDYTAAAIICTLCMFSAESLIVEVAHRMGPRILKTRVVTRAFGPDRIRAVQSRLKRSQSRIIRSIRFTVPFRPYFILTLAALGMDRRKFYKIHSITTLLYIPTLIGSIAWISHSFNLKDWQILVMIGVLWALSIFLPSKSPVDPNTAE